MPEVKKIILPTAFLGSEYSLKVYHFGNSNAANRVYIQAGLHAGEHPGILVAQKLIHKLSVLESQGLIEGRVDIVPVANPIGMAQFINGEINGRYDLTDRVNFNRNFSSNTVRDFLLEQSTLDFKPSKKELLQRLALRLKDQPTKNQAEALKNILLSQALGADLILDLHCDGESVQHLYANNATRPLARRVAEHLGVEMLLLGNGENSTAFDDTLYQIMHQVDEYYQSENSELPLSGAFTLELRGRADVSENFANKDSEGILSLLRELGVIAENLSNNLETSKVCSESEQLQVIHAGMAGIVVHSKNLGDKVVSGEEVAKVIDPLAEDAAPVQVLKSNIDGRIFSRHISKLVYPGMEVIKIA